MFKKTLLATAATAALLGPMAAFAAAPQITFTGTVLDAPCSVTGTDTNKIVDLGYTSIKALTGAKGKGGPATPVEIHLTNCQFDAKTPGPGLNLNKVSITFDGQTDNLGMLLNGNSGNAENVGVQLVREDGTTPVSLATVGGAKISPITAANGVENIITMYARMANTGGGTPKAGNVKITATYKVNYE